MKTCAVIPTYNNQSTICDIVLRTLQYLPVIVVADGPTDGTLEALQSIRDERLTIVDYPKNRGKGYALKQGLEKASEMHFTHALTIDSDGQHYPEDIPLLLRMSAIRPEAIIVGSRTLEQENMPRKNTFANRFSNFWFTIQTAHPLPDTQSGFRVYPLEGTHGRWLMTNRYEAELLLLVFSAWANTPVIPVPIRVYYPPAEQRVSFFRPKRDFFRISVLNTCLCLMALVYGLPRRMWRTFYYALLFLLFALWANMVRLTYCLFRPSRTEQVLRQRLRSGARIFLSAFPGARFQVDYAPDASPLTDRPCVYIANHSSMLDVLALLTLNEHLVVIGKDWVSHNFFFGRIAQSMGVITAGEGTDTILPVLRKQVEKGYSPAIFPEGTRSLYGEIGRFHRGAFFLAQELNLPIRPILLEGMGLALSKSPFHVGAAKELKMTIMTLMERDNTAFGIDYKQQARLFRQYYQHLIDHSQS